MAKQKLSQSDQRKIAKLVDQYDAYYKRFENLASALVGHLRVHDDLGPLIHFIKYRVKGIEELHGKLERKWLKRKQAIHDKEPDPPEEINTDNLFTAINDLAGIRLIHLHSKQFEVIHKSILEVFEEEKYELVEPPTASCWDSEYEKIYKALDIETRTTEGYSSVHYVVKANRQTAITCELQVRTMTDEVWGEVSRKLNYPEPSPSKICIDQLKILARFTTGCTRLVDSIYASDEQAREVEKRR